MEVIISGGGRGLSFSIFYAIIIEAVWISGDISSDTTRSSRALKPAPFNPEDDAASTPFSTV
jgi:hypothetical protein